MEESGYIAELFGGAMRAAMLSRFVDVSQFRQVPDTQEVFSDASSDQSIIFEIAELAEECADDAAAAFHFNSLGHDNDASECQIQTQCVLQHEQGVVAYCSGLQKVAKFNEAAANTVSIHVACFRFRNISTDIVISWNAPLLIEAESSSAEAVDQAVPPASQPEYIAASFKLLVQSFRVLDWSIFSV